MTGQEREELIQDILGQIKYDSLCIEDLVPAVRLDDHDKFELHGGRYVEFFRLVSAIRTEATLDRYRHVERGEWVLGEMYYAGELNPATGMIETSHVWYLGCKYRCLVSGTTEPPLWSSIDWEFEEGDPSFRVYFTGGPAAVNPRSFKITLTLKAEKYNQDVTSSILPQDVVWSRYSEDRDGNERTASDTIWATKRVGSGLSMDLTEEDIDTDINGVPKVCIFTATVTLRDGTEQTASLRI